MLIATTKLNGIPQDPYVNGSHPDHANLHGFGSLTVVPIYEELNELHEGTINIVLAHDGEGG
jgi:hypothetical protein